MATSLRVTELDFDQIKENIKTYFKQQSQFTDYDFEGSGLSVLIDTLAYNTHYNAFYANMALNEIFIDSAVKRESVVSLSKMLNYVPRSARAAIAKITVTVNGVTGSPASLLIDRYTAFTTSIDNQTFTFYNLEPATIIPSGGVYDYENLEVYEGTYVANKFTVGSTPGPAEKFVIPNKNVDTTTIRVTVQDTSTSTVSTKYTVFEGDITDVNDTSTVYFLEQNSTGYYQIYFGDGILGKQLSTGNQITIEYIVTNSTAANISDKIDQSFTLSGTIETYTDATIVVVEKSAGGALEETVDEVRFNAPKYATSQNRLITKKDYEAFLKSKYNYIDAVVVWGGEDNDPPQYGKVFISILPKSNQYLTTTRKNQISADIKAKRAMSLIPTFVDPETFYINIVDTVRYNPNVTNDAASDIEAAVTAAVENYFAQNITTFGDDFSASKLIAAIDNAKTSILSNTMIPTIQKRLTPTAGLALSQKFSVGNKIEPSSISSSRFYYDLLGEIQAARIYDVPDEGTVQYTGTYRRSGYVITVTTTSAHSLTAGEKVTLSLSGNANDGLYTVNQVQSSKVFTVISTASGVDYGSLTVDSERRGLLKIYNPDDNRALNNNIGVVSYDSGIVQINNLNVFGFLNDQTDVRIYFKLTRDSEDIFISRNQILRLDTSTANEQTNRLGGVSISTIAVPK